MPAYIDNNGKMLGEWGNLDLYFSCSIILALVIWSYWCLYIALYDLSLAKKIGLGAIALIACLTGGFLLFILVLFIFG